MADQHGSVLEPVSLVNLGEKDELRMTQQTKNAKTAYAISKPE
jgi:hypothetical protein